MVLSIHKKKEPCFGQNLKTVAKILSQYAAATKRIFVFVKIYFEEELIFAIAVDTRCHRSGELATISGSGRVGAYFLGTGHFIRNCDTLGVF